MTSFQSLLLILSGVAVFAILGWFWFRSHTLNKASGIAQKVFPVWAALGPFKSGAESATAMRKAYLAILGPEEAEAAAEGIAKHAAAFDRDPSGWEKVRKEAAQNIGREAKNLAKNLTDLDNLNKDFYGFFGHKMDIARQPDGSLKMVDKKVKPNKEIEEGKKKFHDVLCSAMGKSLIDDTSEEAFALKAFLTEKYKDNTGIGADSAGEIGKIWFIFRDLKDEIPESELARKFNKLNKAYLATKPDDLANTILS